MNSLFSFLNPISPKNQSKEKQKNKFQKHNTSNTNSNTKKEYRPILAIREVENKFKQIVKEKSGLNFKVVYITKKHSSGKIKQDTIELRISKALPSALKEEHIKELTLKLLKKIEKNPQITQNESHITHFKKALQNSQFKLYDYIIEFTYNNTKTTIRTEIFSELNKKIILSLPQKFNSPLISKKDLELLEKKVANHLCKLFNPLIEEIITKLNESTLNSQLKKLELKYVSSKWGHCTKHNDIMIHIALLNSPNYVLEYVILHELAHTIHKNHSQRFWNLCNSLTPHTKNAKHFLKQTPPTIWKSS